MPRRAWGVVLQLALLAVVGWFVARTFIDRWEEFRAYPLDLQADPVLLVLAALVVWSGYAALIAGWRGVLRGWNETLAPWQAGRIWALSSLGKYIPGKIWAVAGMVVMAQRAGVRPVAAAGSALVMQLLAMGTGAAVVALTGVLALATDGWLRVGLIAVLVASVAGTLVLLQTGWLNRILARLPGGVDQVATPTPLSILGGAAANVLAWGAYGVAVWLLARALIPEVSFPLLTTIGAFAASYIVGFLVLLVPGGLGVREGVFVLVLQGVVGLAPATAIALASRLLFTLTEVGVAVLFLLFPKGGSRAAS
ncbi:MAG: lysylphosphatidylglycerol synthase domain-containing protein [Gemmatimonadetes bacterium]|nr:lysylphosphatidylglycerol synthase domain-containing protein [Gemmatimonadota bacterium]